MAVRKSDQGFTLVELLVVVTVLGIVAAIVVFSVRGMGDKSSDAAKAIDSRIVQSAEETNCAKQGTYATMDELVSAKLLNKPSDLTAVTVDQAGPSAVGPACGGTIVTLADPFSNEPTQVDASNAQSCAVLADETVTCWGANVNGVLGDGTGVASSVAVPVAGLTGVTAISMGVNSACVIVKPDGAVKCWGTNDFGQLGNGTTTNSTTPVTVTGLTGVTQIDVGDRFACATLADHTIRCWGANLKGQLGDGTATNRSTPVAVAGVGNAIQVGASFSESTNGWGSACAVLTDQTVKCWGANANGEIGNGTSGAGTFVATPTAVTGLTGAAAVWVGQRYACSLLASGAAKCWGANQSGQLGDGTTTQRTLPVDVTGLTGGVQLAVGWQHVCVRLSDGTAKCWGRNQFGQLGNGTLTTPQFSPTPVTGLSTITSITAGPGASNDDHTCALLADKTVRCWGSNLNGELGNGVTAAPNQSTPVTVLAIPFTAKPPTLTGASPATGAKAGGTVVTITGTNLAGVTTVWFGTTLGTNLSVNSATSITVTAPAGTANAVVALHVLTHGGGRTLPASYTYGP